VGKFFPPISPPGIPGIGVQILDTNDLRRETFVRPKYGRTNLTRTPQPCIVPNYA